MEDCLLYRLLDYEKEVPANRKLFGIFFTTIAYFRKEATFKKKYTREEELELFKNNIRERFYFIYNVKKIQQTEEGIINISQDAVNR